MTDATPKTQRYRGFILTAKGWHKLQAKIHALEVQTRMRQTPQTIAERVQLNHPEGIHPMTVRKVLKGLGGVDRSSIKRIFQALKLEMETDDYIHAKLWQPPGIIEQPPQVARLRFHQDWGEAIDVSSFYGRTDELAQLKQQVVNEGCRLITLLGMGGIGKTALSVKLAMEVQDEFEYVVWKSIRHAPTLQETLVEILQFLRQPSGAPVESPANVEELIVQLIEQFKQHRCLLVLDQMESILQNLSLAGYYREGYEPYGDFLKVLAEVPHQSCLLLTSREKPREIGLMEGKTVQLMYLDGLKLADSQKLINDWGNFTGIENEWRLIAEHYGGNPLALKIVATRTREYLNGDLSACLEELRQGRLVFSDLRDLIERQFNRLSAVEQQILAQLAGYGGWVSLAQLRQDLVSPVLQQSLLDVLDSLRGRSLLQKSDSQFKLKPFVSEYVREYGRQSGDHSSNALRIKIA